MRLAAPVYESLPLIYVLIGGFGVFLFYVDPVSTGGEIAFAIGILAQVAALTLFLRRRDYRELSREYSGETIELPNSLNG